MDDGSRPVDVPREVLRGWGRNVRAYQPVLRPGPDVPLAELLARTEGRLTPRGGGRAYGDAALGAGSTVVACQGRDRVLALDAHEGTLVVQAGVPLRGAQEVALRAGWTLPVLPGTGWATVGGAVASDVHGKNHVAAGTFGRHVRWLTLVTADGRTRRLAPDHAAEAFWATVGGMGTTGVVDEVALALRPAPSPLLRRTTWRTPDLEGTMTALEAAVCPDDPDVHAVAWLDVTAGGRRTGRGVVERSEPAPDESRAARRGVGRGREVVVPSLPGRGLVGRTTVAASGAARWHLARSTSRLVARADGLSPLDRIGFWPALFGAAGLVQYQFVVPGADDVARALSLLHQRRAPAAMAVLKRFGPAGRAPLSFPRAGWSLAVDLPARWPGLEPALRQLDRLVVACGGRVYLTKDSRLPPELLPPMYPRVAEWRAERDRLDPEGRFTSGLAARLGLVSRTAASVHGGAP